MNVLQDWIYQLTLMQQTILLTALRGPDGVGKYHPVKYMVRWYRRCVLISAFDKDVLLNPGDPRGGSFTGPSFDYGDSADPWEVKMVPVIQEFLKTMDSLPHHFIMHFLQACEVLAYKHPNDRIRGFWNVFYKTVVRELNLSPETEFQLDSRTNDNRDEWLKRNNGATSK